MGNMLKGANTKNSAYVTHEIAHGGEGGTSEFSLGEQLALQGVSTWKSRNRIPYKECNQISQNENVSLDYLIHGISNMNTPFAEQAQSKMSEELAYIQQYDISLSAGHGAYPDEHSLSIGSRPFAIEWLTKKGLKAESLVLTRVMGDSMEPLLKDKDMVMIDKSNIKPSESYPFAIRFEGDLLVKNIQRMGDGSIALVSRNKSYNDIVINPNNPPADFEILGAVVWHAHSWV